MATLLGPLNRSANTTGTTLAAKTSADTGYSCAVGDMLVLAAVFNSTSFTATVADSAGNTWVQEDLSTAGANHRMYIWTCRVTSAIATSGTVTITWSSTGPSRRACQLYKIASAGGFLARNKLSRTTGSTTALSVGSIGTMGDADEYAFKFDGIQGPGAASGRTDSSSGWTDKGTIDSGGTVTSVSMGSSFQALASRGNIANTATATSVSSRASAIMTIRGISAPADTYLQSFSTVGAAVNTATVTPLFTPTTGNTLIAAVTTNENAGADDINDPSFWSLIGTVRNTAGTHVRMKLYGIHVADWIANGSPAMTWTTTVAQRLQISVAEFTGEYNLTAEVTNTDQGTSNTSGTTGTVTPLGSGRLVIMALSEKNAYPLLHTGAGFQSFTVWAEDPSVVSTQKVLLWVGYVDNRGASSTSSTLTWATAAAFAGITVSLAPLSGTVFNLTLSSTGTGTSAFSLKATRALTFTSTGTGTSSFGIKAKRALTATSTGTGTSSFSLNRYRPLAITSTGTGTSAFTLKAKRALTFSSTGTGTSSFTLKAKRALTITSTGSGTSSFALTAKRALTFTSTGTGTSAFALTKIGGLKQLTFASTGTGTSSFTIRAARALAFTSTGTGTSSFALTAKRALTFSSTGSGTSSFGLTKLGAVLVQFTFDERGMRGLPGDPADVGDPGWPDANGGVGTSSFTLSLRRGLTFTSTGTGTSSFGIKAKRALTFSSTGAGTSAFTLTRKRALIFTSTGTGTSSFGISVIAGGVVKNLVFSSTGTGTSTFDLNATRRVKLHSLGEGFSTFNLTVTRALSFSSTGTGTSSFGLTKAGLVKQLTLSSTGVGTSSFALTRKRALTFSSTGTGTSSFTISRWRAFTFTSTGTGTTTFTLRRLRAVTFISTGVGTSSFTLRGRRAFTLISVGEGTTQFALTAKRALFFNSTGVGTSLFNLAALLPVPPGGGGDWADRGSWPANRPGAFPGVFPAAFPGNRPGAFRRPSRSR